MAHILGFKLHFLRRSQKINCVLNLSDLYSNVQTKATYFNHWKWERTKKTFWLKYESVYVDCYSFHCSTYVWLVLFTITYTSCCRLLICLIKDILPKKHPSWKSAIFWNQYIQLFCVIFEPDWTILIFNIWWGTWFFYSY